VRVLVGDWELLMVSMVVVSSFCGEAIFRKSVSTVMYKFRWSILVIMDLLSMMLCVAIILYRRLKAAMAAFKKKRRRRHKKEKLIQRQIDGDDRERGRVSIHSHSSMSTLSMSTATDLHSVGYPADPHHGDGAASAASSRSGRQCLGWKCHVILSTLSTLHMLLTFIPMAELPANVVMVVPLLGVAISSLLNCCISFHGSLLRMRWDNVCGCGILFVSISLLLFRDRSTSKLLTESVSVQKYLIIFSAGCLLMVPIDLYKRIVLSKHRIDAIEFNLIQSVLIMVALWLLSPLIEYVANHDGTLHIDIRASAQNLERCIQCLFSCSGDTVSYPIAHFAALLMWIAINRFALRSLFNNGSFRRFVTNKNAFVQHLTSLSAVIAFVLCYKAQSLWNHTVDDTTLKMRWETLLICIGITVGALLTFRKMDERKVSLKKLEEQWAIS